MGGNSTKATSGINGAGTQSQQDVGIVDSAKLFFEDTKRSVSRKAIPVHVLLADPCRRHASSPATTSSVS